MTTPHTRMLRKPEVMQVTGLKNDSIYRLIREGKFPKPRKLSERASGWRSDEIEAWVASRPVSGEQAA